MGFDTKAIAVRLMALRGLVWFIMNSISMAVLTYWNHAFRWDGYSVFHTNPRRARLIHVELESGETEILVTSLTDIKAFPKELFSELYFSRWLIKEDYKTLKYRIQIENFSGKSVHSVYEDFHAKLVSKNLTAIIATTTREEIIKKSETLKFQHKIDFSKALSKMQNTIVLLFNCTHDLLLSYIEQIRTIFIQRTESIRPGKQYPRKHRTKRKRFDLNYKPSC